MPQFSADSAYQFVAGLCDFGPRVPGTDAQKACAKWLKNQLLRYGAEVKVQEGEMTAYNGTKLPIINIIGSFNPDAKMRVLLMSHWDSRPFADNDPDPAKRKQPVMGANDGASGVGILLELARLCNEKLPQVGIDIFDAEFFFQIPSNIISGAHVVFVRLPLDSTKEQATITKWTKDDISHLSN